MAAPTVYPFIFPHGKLGYVTNLKHTHEGPRAETRNAAEAVFPEVCDNDEGIPELPLDNTRTATIREFNRYTVN